ncbi:related to Polyphosphoinositide phosphatase [Saccharomycodes ludwigii]|uniref:Related to Polyphosphoinositide phosphatase n=1 Tax=Saccharomycodes ludwigii TaxID=36035 RepID=A0A376B3M2_9ASCO|nr:hypothetical protein SCDLUD_004992 [Saccharomycodes ludwigii]KAH3898670.1 hypothetical protein SCDLUD_004992 [Saccharomycodes ludwigii]SSD59251.1 related to Polyphosphoinositide phosphatase [Saccharomycodes ludwigii]
MNIENTSIMNNPGLGSVTDNAAGLTNIPVSSNTATSSVINEIPSSNNFSYGNPTATATVNSVPNNFNQQISMEYKPQRKNKRFILTKYTIYETEKRMYIVGSNKRENMFRILEIDLTLPLHTLSVVEDNIFFTRDEVIKVLAEIDGEDETFHKKITADGLLGFIRFTYCYYLVVVTKKSQVSVLGGHSIFHIDRTELIPICRNYKKPEKSSNETKFRNIFDNLDLSKTFYFSYTYDITNTLQTNLMREKLKSVGRSDIQIPTHSGNSYNKMFMWNENLLRPLFPCIDTVYDWFQPIIHGFIDQVEALVYGRRIYIMLIARRSHHFAGARFLKRGVNNMGYVANEVETEQIVVDMLRTSFHDSQRKFYGSDRYSSFVQHRGSIPLFWSQEATNLAAKPPIEINVVDPFFSCAALHFDRLFQNYGGGPIQILNLIKTKEKTPRETKLLKEFEQCIEYLNQFLQDNKKLQYTSWDMSRAAKGRGQVVIEFLETYAIKTLEQTGIFHNNKDIATTKLQEGVCRTNCIDCLDRTNAAQFIIGKRALGYQLKALGIIDDTFLEYDSDIVNILTELFHDHGDTIALQYGGSHLVNTMETYRKINQWSSHSRDMIESIKRFYSNSFVDAQRQDAINLFLGHYVWKKGQPNIWELNTDFYLHNSSSKYGSPKRSYRHWWNDYDIQSVNETIRREIISKKNDLTIRKIVKNVREYPRTVDNYWNEYYNIRIFTDLGNSFEYKMNSTNNYRLINEYNESNVNNSTNRRQKNALGKMGNNNTSRINSIDDVASPFTSNKSKSLNNKLRSLSREEEYINDKNKTSEHENKDSPFQLSSLDEYELSITTWKKIHKENLKAIKQLERKVAINEFNFEKEIEEEEEEALPLDSNNFRQNYIFYKEQEQEQEEEEEEEEEEEKEEKEGGDGQGKMDKEEDVGMLPGLITQVTVDKKYYKQIFDYTNYKPMDDYSRIFE